MPRIAVVAVVFAVAAVLAPRTEAQSPPPATQKGFSFCSVHDIAAHKVWVSPVFEVEYAASDAWSRTAEMATDFHTAVGALGGTGDKACAVVNNDRAAVEASRNEQRQILTQRFMGVVRANQWLDVAWTPKPWTPALLAKPAVVSKFFYCYGTDTDQRDTTASTVASAVFEKSIDGADAMAPYRLAETYGKEFAQYVVSTHGLTQANPSCYFKDTRAEADKAMRDYRKLFGGFNTKFTVVPWTPTEQAVAPPATATPPARPAASVPTTPSASAGAIGAKPRIGVRTTDVTPALAVGLGLDTPRGALLVEVLPGSPAAAAGLKPMDVVLSINGEAISQAADLTTISNRLAAGERASLRVWRERAQIVLPVDVAGPSVTPAARVAGIATPKNAATAAVPAMPATESRKYCHAFIQFVGKPGGVVSPVWENTGSDGSPAAMAATLTAFTAHMRQLQPKTWLPVAPSPAQCDINNGFCYATAVRQFGRSQLAGQFCKTTRAEADRDWAQLRARDGTMEVVAWPIAQ